MKLDLGKGFKLLCEVWVLGLACLGAALGLVWVADLLSIPDESRRFIVLLVIMSVAVFFVGTIPKGYSPPHSSRWR